MLQNKQQLANAVKKARLELGLTQEQVAEKCNTDVRTIINLEKGRGNPKLETLFPLIRVLKIDAREIFDETVKLDAPAVRHLRLLLNDCSDEEAAVLLPVVESVLNAIRSSKAISIE